MSYGLGIVGALESLRNPLDLAHTVRAGVNLWKGPNTGTSTWLDEVQYFQNDLVTDPVTGGPFVMCGGPDGLTAIRGGLSPALSATGVWENLSTYGVSDFTSPAATATGAGNVYTVVGGVRADCEADSVWLVVWQGTATGGSGGGGVMDATDIATWTVTPTGVGAVVAGFTVTPTVGVLTHKFTGSLVVTCGAATVGPPPVYPQISVSGVYAGTVQTVTVKVSYIRLA